MGCHRFNNDVYGGLRIGIGCDTQPQGDLDSSDDQFGWHTFNGFGIVQPLPDGFRKNPDWQHFQYSGAAVSLFRYRHQFGDIDIRDHGSRHKWE